MQKIVVVVVVLMSALTASNLAVKAQESSESVRTSGKSASENRQTKLTKNSEGAENKDKAQWVKASIEIKAPRDVVWQAVHDERKHDPDLAYSKVITPGEHEYTLEQKMVLIPIFGSAVCEMQNKEVPLERIDYKLIKSDHFKHMEGSWVLSSVDGKNTTLELSTNLDLGIPVPRSVVNGFTAKKLQKRLKHVKEAAETLNAKMALSKKVTAQ